jgi:hypothetical protein
LLKNPGSAVTGELLGVATAALQPIATILQNNRDEYVGVIQAIYPARGSWRDKLRGESNGTVVELRELR